MKLFKRKCKICKERTGVVAKIPGYGIYSKMNGLASYVHLECIQIVIENPELYGSKMVDVVLDLMARLTTLRKHNEEEEVDRQEKLLEARNKGVSLLNSLMEV